MNWASPWIRGKISDTSPTCGASFRPPILSPRTASHGAAAFPDARVTSGEKGRRPVVFCAGRATSSSGLGVHRRAVEMNSTSVFLSPGGTSRERDGERGIHRKTPLRTPSLTFSGGWRGRLGSRCGSGSLSPRLKPQISGLQSNPAPLTDHRLMVTGCNGVIPHDIGPLSDDILTSSVAINSLTDDIDFLSYDMIALSDEIYRLSNHIEVLTDDIVQLSPDIFGRSADIFPQVKCSKSLTHKQLNLTNTPASRT
jgi:hypothetical protein